jgi:hypothetical protein
MNFSSIPTRFPIPFANSGTKNTIPTASQIGITPGAASLTDGFPPRTFHALPPTSDGVPPFGADFNGIFYEITGTQQWQNAGSTWPYDSTFSTAIAGYPLGALLIRADGTGFWFNQTDANTTNPETGGAGWVPINNVGITAITGLASSNVTLTALQSAKNYITLAGTLTANINIIFPTTVKSWVVANNTTGAFTVTCKTSAGSGGTADQGTTNEFYGDGTNIVKFPFVTASTVAATYLTIATAASTYLTPGAGDARYVLSSTLTGSTLSPGYFKLPTGHIVQYGVATAAGSGIASITLPIAFPNGAVSATGNVVSATINATIVDCFFPSNSIVQILASSSSGSGIAGAQMFWQAIGF